ncbi:hypothetical protein HMPREF0059_00368 [Actinomyces viscosus C505]|uniref:Integral membrane protein n=2 Tax=Actinomycetaceae TaxID=2049 RepID=F2UVB7_ACTVI|nr:hypothetical protein HMPREF0059_00368 [Actinomyces viscosus C505]
MVRGEGHCPASHRGTRWCLVGMALPAPPQRRRCDMNLRNLTAPDQWTLSDNSLLRRILVCFLGEVITAVGIAICLEGKSGVDPFTAFLQGISHVSGISFAAIVPIVNIIMLILVFPFDRSIFGLGTVINFTVVGVLVDYFRPIYRSFFHVEYSVGSMLLHLAIGLPLFCLGVSMYITCDLGQCPYDGIAPSLRRHFPRYRYRAYRLVQDIITIFLALLLIRFDLSLGIVALGTVIMGFFIGPIVGFFNNHISNRLVGISGDIFAASEPSSDEGSPAPA